MTTDHRSIEAPHERIELRWTIVEHAQAREQANIAAALVDFTDVPPAVALDLYYKVADRAAAPAGQPGAFPRSDLRGLDKFLRGELRFQLLHYKRDRRRAVPNPEDRLVAASAPSDPARDVEQRQALRDIAQIVNDELAHADLTPTARAYFVADRIEGLKRSEIQRHLGFSEHRIKLSRRELREHDAESLWHAIVARIHDALTNVLPVPVLRLLMRGPGGPSAGEVAAGAAGGTLLGGAGVKIAVACLASLACGGALYVGLDHPHRTPTRAQARPADKPRDPRSTPDRPTRARIPTPTPARTTPHTRTSTSQRRRATAKQQATRDTRSAEQSQPASAPAGSDQTSELLPTGSAGSSAQSPPAPAPTSGGGEFLP